jgi:sec-independent protein translocase protein TatB
MTGSFSEMLFIFLLVLLIFGPRKLPEIARQIGKALAEFRRASNEFKSQLESEMRQIEIEEALRKQPQPAVLPTPEPAPEAGNHDAMQPSQPAPESGDHDALPPAETLEGQQVPRSGDLQEIGGNGRS